VVVPEPPPAPELDHSWLTAPLEEVSIPHDEPELVAEIEHEVVAAEPEPTAEVEAEPAPPLLPSLPPPPLLEPAAVVLPPPPAATPPPAAPPAPEAPREKPKQEKVPLLKRELSFKRKPKAEQTKREKPEQQQAAKAKQAKVPLHKRELSFKRKPKAEQPAADKPKQAKVPLHKRELSFKRKPKAVTPSSRQKSERPAKEKKEKRLVGLKIGASQIAAARVVNNGSPELLQAVRAPLEPGIVVGGELRDPEALAVALKEFFRRNKLPKRGVRLGVANNRIGVRTFEITGIDDPKQLANAVRYRAQEVLPIPLEEAVLDYQILSETVGADGQTTRRILLVVAYRDLVERYVSACRKAGIHLVGVDLEAFALLRALAAPLDPDAAGHGAALVAVSVGHDRSTFAVSDGRVCEFTRVLEWGGYSLDVGIARALDVTPIEAAETKRAISLAAPDEPLNGLSDEQAALAREAVQRQLQSFARELVSSLQFYQSQPGSLSIGEVVLTGGTAGMPGLAGELERLVGVPVRVGDPLGRVKASKKVRDGDQSGSLAVAIGLGIDD
jgi:type IV pilus assembly protein PilM